MLLPQATGSGACGQTCVALNAKIALLQVQRVLHLFWCEASDLLDNAWVVHWNVHGGKGASGVGVCAAVVANCFMW